MYNQQLAGMTLEARIQGTMTPTDDIDPKTIYDLAAYDFFGRIAWIQYDVVGQFILDARSKLRQF